MKISFIIVDHKFAFFDIKQFVIEDHSQIERLNYGRMYTESDIRIDGKVVHNNLCTSFKMIYSQNKFYINIYYIIYESIIECQ